MKSEAWSAGVKSEVYRSMTLLVDVSLMLVVGLIVVNVLGRKG